ncbi:Uncharacterized protein BWINRASL_02538 [Bacillus mycoides]|nr:hypothetical protein IEQ_02254 [Bacillus cereus BAG6X1-2]SCM95083.1 Uncharacterized protein BWINRASL_02538 [Bacillus mycoides]
MEVKFLISVKKDKNHKFSMTLERFEELITTENGLLENRLVCIENVMINPTNISSVVEKLVYPLNLWKLKGN